MESCCIISRLVCPFQQESKSPPLDSGKNILRPHGSFTPPPLPSAGVEEGRLTCLRLSSGPCGGGGRDEDAAAAGIRPGWHPHLPHETAGPLSCSISGRLRWGAHSVGGNTILQLLKHLSLYVPVKLLQRWISQCGLIEFYLSIYPSIYDPLWQVYST